MSPGPAGYTLLRQHPDEVADGGPSTNVRNSTISHLDPATAHAIEEEEDAHLGARNVEATQKVYGPHSKWFLFIGLALASYIYSLDGSTTYAYLAWATSAFGQHSLISSIQVMQSITIAVGKPVIAKLADVTSRSTAYIAVLLFYVLGYVTIASAQNVSAIFAGILLYAIGYTGLQLLTQVIIADITTLQWRGLITGLTSTPFILNGFIGANISAAVIEHLGWRWGYAMFAILVPIALAPLIITLFWAERKAKKLGFVSVQHPDTLQTPAGRHSLRARLWMFAEQLDLVGLTFLGAAIALILLPLTLSKTVKGGWQNGSIVTMLVLGIGLLGTFGWWDIRVARRPVIAARFLANKSIVIAAWIGFFDFMSYFLTYTYLYSFVLVVKPWSLLDVTYFSMIQNVSLTVFGILAGVSMRYLHRYKYLLVIGLIIRVIGVALMIHSRGAEGSDAELVWTQILQGMGGGFAAVSSAVGAQASVPHIDVAMVIAVVLLWVEIGAAVGSAVAGAIWSSTMPQKLAKYLPFLSEDERRTLFGSITDVTKLPRGDIVREGVISAYGDTMKVMVIMATAFSIIPLVLSLFMPNWYLGDKQNAVDSADLSGERTYLPDDDEQLDA